MAGIEPASERFNRRISTSVDGHLISSNTDGPAYLYLTSRLDPKVLFLAVNGVACKALQLCFAHPAAGESSVQVDVAYKEAMCFAFAYAARGIATYEVRLALVFLC